MTLRIAVHRRRGAHNTGGMTRYADEVVRELQAAGHAVEVWDPPPRVAARAALCYANDLLGPAGRRAGADVLWSPFNFGPVRHRLPHVVTVHDLIPITHPRFYRPSITWLYRHLLPRVCAAAQAVLTDSEASKQDLVRELGVPEGKVHAIPLGTRVWQEMPAAGGPAPDGALAGLDGQPFVLHVGGVDPRKNQDRLAAAAGALEQAGYRLVWVGVERAGKGFAHGAGHPLPLRHVRDPQLAWLYANAAATVLASHAEGFGLPVAESLSCGTPVVATRAVPAADENPGLCAFVPPDFTPKQLVEAVRDAERIPVGPREVAAIRAKYDWATAAARHAQVMSGVA